MYYREFQPNNYLKPFVKCYWTLESPKEENSRKQTIVPDGCMEMIFHFGDLYRQYKENGDSIIQPRCFVIGQLTQRFEIQATGKTDILSVRFYPFGFMPFATMRLKEMENRAIALEELFGNEGKKIQHKVFEAKETQERIKIIEQFLSCRLVDNGTIHRIVKSAVETICTGNGRLSVNELSRQTKTDRRQLEPKFSSVVGLSPKQLSKVVRLQATLKNLLDKQFTSLTALAYESEFYDQAHFIRDFKEFTGVTPKQFYSDNLEMSSLFYGSD